MFVFVVVLGPVFVLMALAWVLMPSGFVAAAWPAVALLLSWALVSLPLLFLYRLHERWIDRAHLAHLPESAAEWTRRKLAKLGLTSIDVVTCEGESSAYHPASDSIILRESTYAEHTARARGVAAHELGHAAFFHFRPRLAWLALACRTWSSRLFPAAMSMLIATALVSAPRLRSLAFVLIAAAAALHLVVLADEAGASMRAARLLRAELEPPALRAVVTGHVLALMTYALQLAPMAIALLFWPELIARLGPGVVERAAPLSGWAAALAQLACAALVPAAAIGVASSMRGSSSGPKILSMFFVLVVGPALTFALAGQEPVLAHSWTLALAAIPAWELVALPVGLAVYVTNWVAGRGIDLVAPVTRFIDGPQLQSLRRAHREKVPVAELARHDRESAIDRLWSARSVLLYVPLVFAYWGLLG